MISLKCKSGHDTLQFKRWHPTALRIRPLPPRPYSSRRGLTLVGGCCFLSTLAARPPDQAPGLLPLTLSLHSESNEEAFPGHCTKRRYMHIYTGLPRWLRGKESACNGGATGDSGPVPGSGRSLEEGMVTNSSILAWRIVWTEEPGGLQSIGSKRVRHEVT